MGHRISKVYTRTGDKGTTSLGNATRIDKCHPRIDVIGDIDELNCMLGLVLSYQDIPEEVRKILTKIQHKLFDLGGELSIPNSAIITQEKVDHLEKHIDELNNQLPPLKEFILPSGNQAMASCHLARAICRRAERKLFTLHKLELVNESSIKYLNRLSDLLFVLARYLGREMGVVETLWERT